MTDKTPQNKAETPVNTPATLARTTNTARDGEPKSRALPQADALKVRFKAGSIPLQTDFADLIDLANMGRQAVGGAEGQTGPANGFTLSSMGRLELKLNVAKGLDVDKDGIGLKPEQTFQRGMVMMFAGTTAEIPQGWAVCDGNQGTPDLRDRFIVMAGTKFKGKGEGATDTDNATVTGTVTVDETKLSISQIPAHAHTYTYRNYKTRKYNGESWNSNYVEGTVSGTTSNVGGGQGHKHGATLTTNSHSHTFSAIPPYYALIFIMKL